jgi:hypothetical protein
VTKSTLLAFVLAIAATTVAVLGYRRAGNLEEEVRQTKAAALSASSTTADALAAEVRRLETRIAALEARPSPVAAAPPTPGAPAPVATSSPAPAATEPSTAEVVGSSDSAHESAVSIIKDPKKRAEREQRIEATIDAYWRGWGAKYGLTEDQVEQLSTMELEVARRKLDNQVKLVNGEATQPSIRADNQAAVDDVRRKAQAVLTPAQFAQFEADKGAEYGSSYRKVREASAKDNGGSP